jgi:predicted molibdopterin-dependent oxidoreductase YjgC
MLDGPGESRYIEERRHKNKRYPLGDLIVLDQERCVLCWRCIRFLDEWADDHELDLFGRGADTRIDTFPGRPLRSKWQGNTIDICPVGALTSRIFRFEARVWELTNTPSVCPMCSVGCNIVLGVKNNQLRRITPRENMEVNDSWICDKGRFAHDFVDHVDRLTTPLIRRKGEFQPATWDEALDFVAQRVQQVIEEHGPQAVGGLGSTRVTNEANYLFQRFMRTAAGNNNVDHLERIPDGVRVLDSLPDLENKDVILLLGSDPSTEAPLVELWLKKAILRHGAQIVVANPWQIELGRYGGPWLGNRPGNEVALMHGLAHAMLHAEPVGKTMRGKGPRVSNVDEFQAWLREYSPGQMEQATGTAAQALQQAAQLLTQARRPIILYGPRWAYGSMAEANINAALNVALLLGDTEAAFLAEDNNSLGAMEMGVVPDVYPGYQPFQDNKVRNRLASFWGGRLSPVEGLDFDGMMMAARDGELHAMWIMGADPANDCRIAGDALGRIPFLVVQDMFMTDTASLAEVVLPAASFAESNGSFTNLTGRMQAIWAAKRPPGEARPDWWIIAELGKRMMGAGKEKAWDFSGAADILSEISKVLPGYRGITYTKMGETGWQRPAAKMASRRAFVRITPKVLPPDPEYPLSLAVGRMLYDRGTLLRRSKPIQDLVAAPHVMVHPHDAEKLDLVDGDEVSVVSAKGRLRLRVSVSNDIVPGVVFIPLNVSDAPLSVLFADRWTTPHVQIVK